MSATPSPGPSLPGSSLPSPSPPDPGPSFHVDENGAAWITFDDPERKVNVLTEQVLARLGEHLGEARTLALQGKVHVVVLWSAKSGFFAGADLEVIESLEDPSEGAEGSRFGQRTFFVFLPLLLRQVVSLG